MKTSPIPVDVHVGKMIRAQRQAIGLTQTQLGEAIGVTFQQVQKYEKGVNRVGASRMVQIATALKVDPSFFFPQMDGGQTAAPEIMALLATPHSVDLLRAFAAIEKRTTRSALVALVQAVAETGVRPAR